MPMTPWSVAATFRRRLQGYILRSVRHPQVRGIPDGTATPVTFETPPATANFVAPPTAANSETSPPATVG